MSLRRKIFWMLVGIVLVSVVPIILFSSYSLFKANEKSCLLTLDRETQQVLRSLDRYFFERVGDLKILARKDLILNKEASRKELTVVCKQLQENYKSYDSIIVLDLQGKVLSHTSQLEIGEKLKNVFPITEIFREKNYRMWSESQVHGHPKIRLAVPVRDFEGNPFRIIVAEIYLDRLSDLINGFIGKGIKVELYSYDGVLLYSNPSTIQNRFDLHSTKKVDSVQEKFQEWMNLLIDQNKQMILLNEKKYFSLVAVNQGFRDFRALSWFIMIKQERSIALKEWRWSFTITLLGMGVGLLVMGFALFPISKFISRPLIEISSVAEEIGKGNFKKATELPKRNDELGILSDRMKEMSQKIENSFIEIQKEKQETQNALEKAQLANRSREDFLAVMSHELRTPLNGINGFARLLSESPIGSDYQEQAKIILQSGEEMLHMVSNILDFSKMNSSTIEFEAISFSLNDLIKNGLDLISTKADEKGVELIFDVLPHDFYELIGDPHRIQQIINNLLSNAIKFTRNGFILVKVRYANRDDLTGQIDLELSVEDSGIGISPDKINSIFDPFVQADSSVRRQYGGTGLGLAICRKIVEARGGIVEVESELGRGSRFTVKNRVRYLSESSSPIKLRDHPLLSRGIIYDFNPSSCEVLKNYFRCEVIKELDLFFKQISESDYSLGILLIPSVYDEISIDLLKQVENVKIPLLILQKRSLKVDWRSQSLIRVFHKPLIPYHIKNAAESLLLR